MEPFNQQLLHNEERVTINTNYLNMSGSESFYDNEDNLKKLCNFLRSKEGPAVREAVEMDKRVYYLKGPFLVILI